MRQSTLTFPANFAGLAILRGVVLCLLPFLAISAQDEAQTTSREGALQRLKEALKSDESLDPRTRQALQDLVEVLKAETRGAPTPPSPPQKGAIAKAVDEYLAVRGPRERAAWEEVLDDLALYGDFRLRHESSFDLDDKSDRHRVRVRLRLGANYQPWDDVLIGARVITGDRDDPNSPHVTLGDGFKDLEISLDRAFLTYRPSWLDGSYATAGKFGHPFYANPVYSELVWDADVQPEGFVAGYTFAGLGPMDSVTLAAGGYFAEERSTSSDSFLPVAQAVGQLSFVENTGASLAVGYYHYTNVDTSTLVGDNAGNAVSDKDGDGIPDDYVSDFGILNPILAFNYTGWKLPVTLAAEYILNTEARTSDDQGWAAGFSIGTTRSRGDWRIYYQYQVVEQDAVFSSLAQDDFLFATNHRSHIFGANYQIMDKIGLHLWGLVSQLDKTAPGATTDSDRDQWRARADLNVRF